VVEPEFLLQLLVRLFADPSLAAAVEARRCRHSLKLDLHLEVDPAEFAAGSYWPLHHLFQRQTMIVLYLCKRS
jgi:hypothetical protein